MIYTQRCNLNDLKAFNVGNIHSVTTLNIEHLTCYPSNKQVHVFLLFQIKEAERSSSCKSNQNGATLGLPFAGDVSGVRRCQG